jgi:signal transduction histidine kinase
VLSKSQQIANGDLSISVPVVGNDFYAKMAAYINILKTSYIHALNEQKKSERLKYELVTNISHDLRTPLTSILNYIGLVKKKSLKSDVDKYADHVETNAKRLNILIEDLFELSKIESGNMQLDISNVDLVLMVKQISHEYGEKMSQNGLELILKSKSKQIIRQCDGQKMWRVFDNLINNAVKYSLPGTRIYVSIEELSEQLLISVKNIASYRIDFEPEELFLRFKRGDRARSSDGSGLGLAIAKSIVELHNGSIAIETEGDMFKVIMKFCSDSYVSCIV